MNSLKMILIQQGAQALLALLPPETLREIADSILDKAEDAIANSETSVDDAVALPLIRMLRTTFNIPDGDD